MKTAAIDTSRIPQCLRDAPQWVLWRFEDRDGKLTKPPHQCDGSYASHADPATWARFERAFKAYERGGFDGIGFVLADMDPFAGVDLDHVFDKETGEVAHWAQEIVDRLNSYTEISPSGTGIRIFVRGALPDGFPRGGRKKSVGDGQGVEVYCRLRYLTVTGRHFHGAEVEDRGEEFQALCREMFPEVEKPKREHTSNGASTLAIDDSELLRQMFSSKSGAAIIQLWNGDTSAHNDDDSAADLALCDYLAWWCAGDADRMDRLFRQSRLFRGKWTEDRGERTYGQMTLDKALESFDPNDCYQGPAGPTFDIDGPHAIEPGTRSELEDARALLDTLAEEIKNDPGFVHLKSTRLLLGCLRALDLAAWERARKILLKARIAFRSLESALPPISYYLPKDVKDADGQPAGSYAADGCPDCPTPTLTIPSPYSLSPTQTLKARTLDNGKTSIDPIAHAPMIIEGRMRDEEDRRELLRIAWKRPGSGWMYHVMDRGAAVNSSELIKYASFGLPVASDNAKEVATYFHHLEAANFASIRSARVSSHLGWQGEEGRLGFLWGRHLITPDGNITEPIDLEKIHPAAWEASWVGFRGHAGGDEQIAGSYHRMGSLEGQIETLHRVSKYPRVILALYASLTAPLLMITGAPNPIIDWANRTSTGKTTALRLAASIWGKPDEKAPDGALTSWGSTRVGIERRCMVCTGLPVIVDDSKQASRPESIASITYDVVSGRGKGRGTIQGLAVTGTWRLPMLSSGEQTLVSFTNDGGTRARVMEITGAPFGKGGDETRQIVEATNRQLLVHYGHIGPFFVSWLLRYRERWPKWKAWYQDRIEHYAEKAQDNVVGRMAHTAAIIDLAAVLVHECFKAHGKDLPWDGVSPLHTLWKRIEDELSIASPEVRALQDVMSWAYSNQDKFFGRHNAKYSFDTDDVPSDIPKVGFFGAWSRVPTWETIAFEPTTLKEQLKRLNHSPEAIIEGWAERGWLVREGKHKTKKVSIGGENRPRYLVITREAVDEVDE